MTVIDASEFHNNLDSMICSEEAGGTIAELMMQQVEFSNVVVLNKEDLINEDQKYEILHKVSVLNPKAKVCSK